MSRAVPLDHTFNKSAFSKLLIKAKGERQQKTFAEDIGMNKSYLSCYINEKVDNPPTPSTIKKIYDASKGSVSYEELLDAAGYSSIKYTTVRTINSSYYGELCMATITNALFKCMFKWSANPLNTPSPFDLSISIEDNDNDIDRWVFDFVPSINASPNIEDQIYTHYAYIVISQNIKNEKIKLSFVTDSKEKYEYMTGKPPFMLPMYVSVILINAESMSILKEEYVPSHLTASEALKSKYSLISTKKQA